MAQRQGIALGPVELVNRYAKAQTNGYYYLTSVQYVSPLPAPGNFKSDIKTILSTMIVQDNVIYSYHIKAIKALLETALSHYHVYDDFYQIPTYNGAYGNYGYNDDNGGAGDRKTYSEVKNSSRTVVASPQGGGGFTYSSELSDSALPVAGVDVGDKILSDDYLLMKTATANIKTHTHLISDRKTA